MAGPGTALAVGVAAVGMAMMLGASGTSSGSTKKPPAKSETPQVSEEDLRRQSTNMYRKPPGSWPGGAFSFALKESLTQSAYSTMGNYYVTSQTQSADGTHVWELSPRTNANAPSNSDLVPMIAEWKKMSYSVLCSWDQPYPRPGKRRIVLVPPGMNPFTDVDTSGDVVVLFSALYPPPSPIVPQGQGADDPKGEDVASLDELPVDLREKVQGVLDKGTSFQMKQTAGALQGAGYTSAAQFVLDRARERTLSRKTTAISSGAYEYKLRPNEQWPYYFAELITGDGSRYKEMLPLNKGKLKQSAKGVDGWNAGVTIRHPVDWGDLDDREPLPLAHGSAPPKPGSTSDDKKGSPYYPFGNNTGTVPKNDGNPGNIWYGPNGEGPFAGPAPAKNPFPEEDDPGVIGAIRNMAASVPGVVSRVMDPFGVSSVGLSNAEEFSPGEKPFVDEDD